ncbi:Uncharacterised protein [Candidatus Venteria ishoeyi]|uniref:Uncharacterized protein n=1 Tax=Candidatus Venteria ishoeyi TaxID=1899563 RepID=A0A1H6FCY3_9GAMM|nr:Uncharacterised protein [Candidatus Venteria ishoeyi]
MAHFTDLSGMNGADIIPGVLPLAILMRPVGAKQQGLSALYLGFQPPNALTHPFFSGWLFRSENFITSATWLVFSSIFCVVPIWT